MAVVPADDYDVMVPVMPHLDEGDHRDAGIERALDPLCSGVEHLRVPPAGPGGCREIRGQYPAEFRAHQRSKVLGVHPPPAPPALHHRHRGATAQQRRLGKVGHVEHCRGWAGGRGTTRRK